MFTLLACAIGWAMEFNNSGELLVGDSGAFAFAIASPWRIVKFRFGLLSSVG
jgi:hypothetical protein